MRASYNWVSMWRAAYIWHYLALWLASMVAFWRVRPKAGRLFLLGLPAIGILSMPLSYLLLEKLKWGLIPQFQPARAVLFVSAFAMILGAAAAIRAESRIESAFWFALVLAIPMSGTLFSITSTQFWLLVVLAVAMCLQQYTKSVPLLLGVAVAPFFLLPTVGGVRNYATTDRSSLQALAQFADSNTPKDSIFLFADAGRSADPSIFRAIAKRAVYVDWKAGGQINYHESLGMEWWQRWQETNELRYNGHLPAAGINYLVLTPAHRLAEQKPIFENSNYVLYSATR